MKNEEKATWKHIMLYMLLSAIGGAVMGLILASQEPTERTTNNWSNWTEILHW